MTDIVEEARALLAQATPGPWNDGITEIDAGLYGCTSVVEATCNPTKWGGCGGCELRISKPDRALIAATPRLLAALADECERLRKQNSEYHRRTQRAESATADSRREAIGQRMRADWWRSEAKRLEAERAELGDALRDARDAHGRLGIDEDAHVVLDFYTGGGAYAASIGDKDGSVRITSQKASPGTTIRSFRVRAGDVLDALRVYARRDDLKEVL